MGTVIVKPPRERAPGPFEAGRQCACGARLSRYNPSDSCAPCSGGSWDEPELTDREVHKHQQDLLREVMEMAA